MYGYTSVPTKIYHGLIIEPNFKSVGVNKNNTYSIINNCDGKMDMYTPKCPVPLYLEHIKYNDDETEEEETDISSTSKFGKTSSVKSSSKKNNQTE